MGRRARALAGVAVATAGAGTLGLGGLAVTAAPAGATNWNIPRHINDEFCSKEQGRGTVCTGYYNVNRTNYVFTQDALHYCPRNGALMTIELYYWGGDMLSGYTVRAVRH